MKGAPRTRLIAVGALVAGIIVAGLLLFATSQPYTVKAKVISATQLVKGNRVQVAGAEVGEIKDIQLTDDSRAELTLTVDDDFAPLRLGTRAIIRQLSQSGQANRYIDLQLGPSNAKEIPAGGLIPGKDITEAIELDQLFNIFDPAGRKGLQGTIKLFSELTAGQEDDANRALQYLNPAMSSSSRLFDELTRDKNDLRRFITETAKLTGDLAARDDDLAGLVRNLGTTMNALAVERDPLGDAIERLPDFMRRSNSTFVNLRATLDDLDPLVETAKPVVRNDIRPLFDELRPFARQSEPTVRDLSRTITRPGGDNDLIDLLRRMPAVERIANETAVRNGERRPGAFPASRAAVEGANPQISFLRNYAPDLVGWFDDFSSSGMYDALGGFSRAGLQFNAFTFAPGTGLLPVPPQLRNELFAAGLTIQNNRCPGSVERPADDRSNPFRDESGDLACDPSQVPPGR